MQYVTSWMWTALAIGLIVLKALKKITWSWWWVLAPIWLPIALALLLAVLGVGAFALFT